MHKNEIRLQQIVDDLSVKYDKAKAEKVFRKFISKPIERQLAIRRFKKEMFKFLRGPQVVKLLDKIFL